MSKIVIVTDSNSGLLQEDADRLGVKIVPMPFYIDDTEYFENINLSQNEFYDKLEKGAVIHTSQPSPEFVMNLWSDLLKEYDEVVYIPMSSGLSSSCQTAKMLMEDYDGKVQVVDNQRISVTMIHSIYDALKMIEEGKNASEIREYLENDKANSSIYITLDTLSYLKKGGRITPAAAALGTILKIKPVLQIQGDKLDEFAKARTISSAKTLMLNAIKEDIEGRITDNGKYGFTISVAHTCNPDVADSLKEEIQSMFPECKDIIIASLPLSVSCHIGPGSFAVAASRKY